MLVFFFFKQKTAYEMRISEWSSDVCSSDLGHKRERSTASGDRWRSHGRNGGRSPRAESNRRPRRFAGNFTTCGGPPPGNGSAGQEIGRASCRERVCQYV